MFECSAKVVLQLWNMIISNADIQGSPKIAHLLWALMFLKIYSKETVTSRLAGGVDEKTYRKWVWIFVTAIADLEVDVVRKFLPGVLHAATIYHYSFVYALVLILCFLADDRLIGKSVLNVTD